MAYFAQVRVVIGGLNGFNISQLDNSTAREQWINGMLGIVQMSYADGINLDIEEPINNGSLEQELLTKLVLEVYLKFKSVNKNYQVNTQTGSLFTSATVCSLYSKTSYPR